MKCPNCNNNINGTEKFCPYCGKIVAKANDVPEISSSVEVTNSTPQPQPIPNNNKQQSNKKLIKYLIITIVSGVLLFIFIIVGAILYFSLFGKEKLEWNDAYLDKDTKYVTQTKLKLGVKFPQEKAKYIKYETTCGTVKGNDLELVWDLSDSKGKCKITAAYKLRKIKKTLSVIPVNIKEKDLSLEYNIDENSDEDLDFDGLTNKEEKQHKTNPVVADSDLDGLDDKYELETSKTNPNKKDSDNDGLSDYDEIELGLDPNNADSKGDGIKDGERSLTYNRETDNLKITVKGKGNIASTVSEINSNTKISNKKGLIDKLYSFNSEGKIEEAIITISYTDEEIQSAGLNEDELSFYYYNEKKSKYEKVASVVDKENNTVTATLKHFSNYVVGDSQVKESPTNQVLFVLDNSWSMYTDEQYKELTGKEVNLGIFGGSLEGSDEDGVRFTLTSELVQNLSQKNFEIGLSEFRRDYKNALPIGSDASKIKEKLNNMNGIFITSTEGTNITNAITSGIEEFSDDAENRYLILLTDGQDSSLKSNVNKIINEATSKDVKVCSVGFGAGSSNIELSNISNSTGCKFYSSGDVKGLDELFDNIETELDDGQVDIDGDDNNDGILIADSGFLVNRDGFSFDNYVTNQSPGGHCFGMATFAELYYKKALPLAHESITVKNDKSYNYDLSSTYFDGYNKNLFDYNFKTNAFKYYFGYERFGETEPSDFHTVNNNILEFNEKYKKEIMDSGIYEIKIEKTGLDKEAQLKKYGVNYDTYEEVYLNADSMQKGNIRKDDLGMFNAIYALFIKQFSNTFYTSSSNFTLWLRNVIGTETDDYSGEKGFINILKSRLNDHDPVVISSNYNGGLHAINAINLVQDIDNPNYYYIGVYDNNYPGEKRYVDVECNNGTCVTKANKYYSSSGEPIRITPSLEYDLSYFEIN